MKLLSPSSRWPPCSSLSPPGEGEGGGGGGKFHGVDLLQHSPSPSPSPGDPFPHQPRSLEPVTDTFHQNLPLRKTHSDLDTTSPAGVCVCVCGSNPMFSFSASYFLRSHGADLVTAHINCSQRQKRNRIRCIYSSELKLCWRCKKTLKVTPGIWLMTFFGFLKLRNNLFLWVWATQVKRLKILFYFRINYSLYLRFYLMCFCVSSQKKYLVCIILGSFVLLLGSIPY